ncbi:DUF1189 family protein [Indiicoccus explosivorum]|uniref:DUF1189 family protein n=1 Tax=Indiicoccus explosivorum TaxID=1917864 RepID=UPI000B4531B5|nr:DUF1189 family protein [Indiicoccus explosivorum]
MTMYQLFKAALKEPKKQAAARVLPIGKVLKFVFLFIAILTAAAFIGLVGGLSRAGSGMEGYAEFTSGIGWLLYPFALFMLFVTTTVYHFAKISIFALFGLGFLKARRRKGEYRHVWRTASLAVTGPTLLSVLLDLAGFGFWASAAMVLLTLWLLWQDASFYPKMPPGPPASSPVR